MRTSHEHGQHAKGTTYGRSKTTKRASAMRFQVFNAFVDERMASGTRTKPPSGSCCFVIRSRTASPARPSMTSPVGPASAGDRLRALKRLERLRMLQVTRRGGLNRGVSAYRVFPFPAPDEWG